jgi:hypothetical protein
MNLNFGGFFSKQYRSPDFVPMRAALRRTPADHFAQVRLCRRQTLHAHVRVFELHGPFARGSLHRTCATRPSLRLLVNLPSGGRVLDLDVLLPPSLPSLLTLLNDDDDQINHQWKEIK